MAVPTDRALVDILPQNTQKLERRKYKRTLYWFGFIEIIIGIASCGVSIVGLAIASAHPGESMLHASSGIWCGLPMITSGNLGVRVNHQSSPWIIKANMTASIISSIFMAVMFMMSVFAALSNHVVMAIFVFLSILASAGFILNIVHATFCCATICCIRHLGPSFWPLPTEEPIVHYTLVDGQQMLHVGYPGPPVDRQLTAPAQPVMCRRDSSRAAEPSTPPPPYTSRENLNEGPSTSN